MGITLDQFASNAATSSPQNQASGTAESLRSVARCVERRGLRRIHSHRRRPERKVLYEDPKLGFCILAHNYQGARESAPHDHGPYWAIYGQGAARPDDRLGAG